MAQSRCYSIARRGRLRLVVAGTPPRCAAGHHQTTAPRHTTAPRLAVTMPVRGGGLMQHQNTATLESATGWQKSIVLSNVRNNRLIMTYANSGYAAFLQNYIVGLRALQVDEFVVVALDSPTWSLLHTLGLEKQSIHFGLGSGTAGGAVSWYDAGYRRLMGTQPSRVLTVFGYGQFDLLVTDADVIWRRAPWPILEAASRRQCEVQAIAGGAAVPSNSGGRAAYDAPVRVHQPHPKANCAACLNAGFIYLRRTPRVTEFLRRWERQLHMQREQDTNQKWLNWVLATGGVRPGSVRNASALMWADAPTACQLPPTEFPNGLIAHTIAQPADHSKCTCAPTDASCAARMRSAAEPLVAAHLNYALSADAKVCTAKSLGLWLASHRRADRAGFVVHVGGGGGSRRGGLRSRAHGMWMR